MLKDILISLRPQQWLKNIVLFAGLIFSMNFFHPVKFGLVLAAALIFSLAAGSIYLLNDVLDAPTDRLHPFKKKRPIAAGRLSVPAAVLAFVFLMVWSLAMALILNRNFFLLLGIYAVIEILYSTTLKNVVILDLFCIAAGFFLRVLSGAAVIDVPISSWLVICTIFLSLFLGLAKRRSELVLLNENAVNHRRVLSDYSLSYLDQMIMIVTASTILAYALYTLAPETRMKFHDRHLEFTIIFVVYGVFRYLYLVYQKHEGGAPEKVLISDKPMLVNLVLYLAAALLIVY